MEICLPHSYWGRYMGGCVAIHYHGDYGYGSHFTDLPDTPEVRSFVVGTMPCYVFADWLEENIPDIHPKALELLRLPWEAVPVLTIGRNNPG